MLLASLLAQRPQRATTPQSGIYIPPPGVQFRICNRSSGKVIYSSLKNKPEVSHADRKDVKDDQWFYLIHGTGNRAGTYAIKGKESDRVIFSRRHAEPYVSHVGGDGKYNDNWHVFEPGTGTHAGYFRILTPSPGNTVLVSRNHAAPYFTNYENKIAHYDDQDFEFEFEPCDFSSVEWKYAEGKIVSTEHKPIGDIKVKNNLNNEQEYSLNLDVEEGFSGQAEWVDGFPIHDDGKYMSVLPIIRDGSIVAGDKEVEWSLNTPVSDTKSETTKKSFYVDAKTTAHATATVDVSSIEVPFVIKLKGKRSGKEVTARGIWHGHVSGADLKYEEKKQPL